MADKNKLNFSLLNILPFDEDVFESAPLFKCMFKETKGIFEEEQVLPCKDGTYSTADLVRIARNTDLAEIFTTELLTELFMTNGRQPKKLSMIHERPVMAKPSRA